MRAVLALSALLAFQSAIAQVDLPPHDQLFVRVTTPDDEKFDLEQRYLSGLIVSYMRGTGEFIRVHAAADEMPDGLLLDIAITRMRVIGGVTRLFGGVLAGKDRITANVRFVEVSTDTIVAETAVDGSGSQGFLWNHNTANIVVAMNNFAAALVEWSGFGDARFGAPTDWQGVVGRNGSVSIRCTGIDKKTANFLVGLDQSNETVCSALQKSLHAAHIKVVDDSPIVLTLSLEAMVSAIENRFKPTLVMRWRIDGPNELLLDDTIANSREKTRSKKAGRISAAELIRVQVQTGVDALFPIDTSSETTKSQ